MSGDDEFSRAQHRRDFAERRASWEHITAQAIRLKLQSLEGHPMRAGLGRLLAKCIAEAAPHHLGLIPAEWHPKDGAP